MASVRAVTVLLFVSAWGHRVEMTDESLSEHSVEMTDESLSKEHGVEMTDESLSKEHRVEMTDQSLLEGNATRGPCTSWEVCRCHSDWQDDTGVGCDPNSCIMSAQKPAYILCWYTPTCAEVTKWKRCAWANWNTRRQVDLPGQDIYIDVPQVRPQPHRNGFVVLSDVDDTMKCSGGGAAGFDTACLGTAKHQMYPGAALFALALARGPSDNRAPLRVVPLSARPLKASWVLGMKETGMEYLAYAAAGQQVGIQNYGLDLHNVKYGRFRDFTGAVKADTTRFLGMAYTKYKNWRDADWGLPTAFIGDNGQGDAVAAQMMLKRSQHLRDNQGALRVAFIHDVMQACHDARCHGEFQSRGIYLFQHYAHAAEMAYADGFISQRGCASVCGEVPIAVKRQNCRCER